MPASAPKCGSTLLALRIVYYAAGSGNRPCNPVKVGKRLVDGALCIVLLCGAGAPAPSLSEANDKISEVGLIAQLPLLRHCWRAGHIQSLEVATFVPKNKAIDSTSTSGPCLYGLVTIFTGPLGLGRADPREFFHRFKLV